MPILSATGGLSARAYGLFGAQAPLGAFESIQTTQFVSGTTYSSITFNSIPATYKHLQIRIVARGNNAAVYDSYLARFNGDSANNYTLHWLSGDGTTASSLGIAPYGGIRGNEIAGASAGANVRGVSIMDIYDYASTSKFKTVRAMGGDDRAGSGSISLNSGVWMNTSAITSIVLTPVFGGLFTGFSSFALYGIKG